MSNKNFNHIALALSYYGEKAISGLENNPVIVDFYKLAKNGYITNDEVPWCAAFVNAILQANNLPQSGKLNARSLLEIGVPTDRPALGDLVILWRGSKDGIFGHAGFFIREVGDFIYILGGNQDNAVNIRPFLKDRLLGYRSVIID